MNTLNFTKARGSIVYVIYAVKGEDKFPFYVGESGRGIARIADYITASFGAPTDFKVGRTARLLESKGYEIIIKIGDISERKKAEKEKIEEFKDYPLLNSVESYDYKTTNKKEYEAVLQNYVDRNFTI